MLMIQGHLQCQKVKLNILNVTKYEDIIYTKYKWEFVLFLMENAFL